MMMNHFESNIVSYISRHDLMCYGGFYIVALSGGPDSVALLRVLCHLGYHVEAAHCNFHLRGKESNRDEEFCVTLCEELGVKLHRIHFDTVSYADLHKVSMEMAARDLRYHYFDQLREDLGADGICVAHHKDDQVETILLNLIRGTGLRGLQGMRPRNQFVLRPMLGVSRAEILTYLDELHQPYVVDSTNLQDDAQRNKIRLNVMPLLEAINPSVKDNVVRMSDHLHEVDKIVADSMVRQSQKVCVMPKINDRSPLGAMILALLQTTIRMDLLAEQPSPEYLLWYLLKGFSFHRTQVLEMLHTQHHGSLWKSDLSVAVLDRENLFVVHRKIWEQSLATLKIPEEGVYQFTFSESVFHLRITFRDVAGNPLQQISRDAFSVTLDADSVHFPLVVRPAQPGDRLTPFGMKGSRLASDVLTDAKVSVLERHCQLVVADASEQILWLVGRRVDAGSAVHVGTKRIVSLTLGF